MTQRDGQSTESQSERHQPSGRWLFGFSLALITTCFWSTADWISERKAIEWIAEIVNRAQPEHARFMALDSSDHFYLRAKSMRESFCYFKPPKKRPFGQFNPAILKSIVDWLDERSGTRDRRVLDSDRL